MSYEYKKLDIPESELEGTLNEYGKQGFKLKEIIRYSEGGGGDQFFAVGAGIPPISSDGKKHYVKVLLEKQL